VAAAPSTPPPAPRVARSGVRGAATGAVQYGARDFAAARVRLSADEQSMVRYVLAEWSGEAGCRSSFGAMAERLVQYSVTGRPDAAISDAEVIHCATGGDGMRADRMFPQEQWSNDRRDRYGDPSHQAHRRNAIVAAYRALCELARKDVVTLQALYGDRPPWVPAGNLPLLWDSAINADYWRVAPMTDSYAGMEASLERFRALRRRLTDAQVAAARDDYRRDEYKAAARKLREDIRKLEAAAEKSPERRAVGKECEVAIADATRAYWRAA
jgi:hypothetical protein